MARTTPEQFVEIWQTADNIDEVSKKAGIKPESARMRASLYRKKGVPLKRMTRSRRSWEDLADLAESFGGEAKVVNLDGTKKKSG